MAVRTGRENLFSDRASAGVAIAACAVDEAIGATLRQDGRFDGPE
jgi:hypothetical protein